MTQQGLKIVRDDEIIIKKSDYNDFKDITAVANNHCKLIRCKDCNRIIASGFSCIHCGSCDPR